MTVARLRLRILMVDSERRWRGGQGQVFLLMRGLVDAGVSVALAAPPDGVLHARAAELDVERLPWRAGAGPVAIARLRHAIARGGFDIVHSHASRAHGAVAMARVGVRGGPRHVVSRRVDFEVGRGWVGAWKYRRGADAYIAISRGVRDVLIRGGVDAARIDVVPSGIDLEKLKGVRDPGYLREEFGLRAGERVLGNVAALAPHKAQAVLLRAVAMLPGSENVRTFVVGEGSLRSDLERLARELGIEERVVFTGFRSDALEFIRLCDVFVMSSHLEGLGTSIMDAQALGAPVVATRTGGIPELVEDGVTGLLVPPDSPSLLAAAIARMLGDATLRERCAREAKALSAGYDYRQTVYKTLDVYRRLCDVDVPPGGNRAA